MVCVAGPTTYIGIGGGVKSGSYGFGGLLLFKGDVDTVPLCIVPSPTTKKSATQSYSFIEHPDPPTHAAKRGQTIPLFLQL